MHHLYFIFKSQTNYFADITNLQIGYLQINYLQIMYKLFAVWLFATSSTINIPRSDIYYVIHCCRGTERRSVLIVSPLLYHSDHRVSQLARRFTPPPHWRWIASGHHVGYRQPHWIKNLQHVGDGQSAATTLEMDSYTG